jgi:hypothetical protein
MPQSPYDFIKPVWGTNLDPRLVGVIDPEVIAAHRRLFGDGAKMGGERKIFNANMSIDERAMELRPRSANYGKDIELPSMGKAISVRPLIDKLLDNSPMPSHVTKK